MNLILDRLSEYIKAIGNAVKIKETHVKSLSKCPSSHQIFLKKTTSIKIMVEVSYTIPNYDTNKKSIV